MNPYRDPELEDVLQDRELRRIASLLSTARTPEPPLDDAFRTGLRRQLMQEAWAIAEGRESWWRRAFAPPGIAWAGAVAGVLLIAAVAVYTAQLQSGSTNQVVVGSTFDGKSNVALQQPILVSFNQPMDHQSTESAVQIVPATSVTYMWDPQSRILTVTPVSGNLAPNTQYQVTIGPGAKTATNQQLPGPQTITFVTQAPPTATPTPPTPRPTPANPLNERQLAPLGVMASLSANPTYRWSADSASLYYIDTASALRVVTVRDGSIAVIAANGVTSLAISPAGDRLAYIRAGKIVTLTFASGKTDELTPNPVATVVGWAKDKLVWAASDGVYGQTDTGQAQLAALPNQPTGVSLASDAGHAVYASNGQLYVLDLASGSKTQLGPANATFAGWAPDGTLIMYATTDQVIVSNVHGTTLSTLPSGQASWSRQDAILLGGDTALFQVRPDASNLTRLASGTYRSPLWAPDGSSFAFVRGDALWVATAPALPPLPTVVDEAGTVVKKFMDARLNGRRDEASSLLSDNGKKAYAGGGLNLLIDGDPHFSRYYVLVEEPTAADPDTVRFVVRLVLSHQKKDVSDFEETLTLVRDAAARQFVIDQAAGSPQRELGKGPEVVTVDFNSSAIQVTFDSDLDPGTIKGSVLLLDGKGNQADASVGYANRTVTLSGLDLSANAQYRLVVLASLRDVQGHGVAAEYDLNLVGPIPVRHASNHGLGPSPSPSRSGSGGGGAG